jgi:hypothetical protein
MGDRIVLKGTLRFDPESGLWKLSCVSRSNNSTTLELIRWRTCPLIAKGCSLQNGTDIYRPHVAENVQGL